MQIPHKCEKTFNQEDATPYHFLDKNDKDWTE